MTPPAGAAAVPSRPCSHPGARRGHRAEEARGELLGNPRPVHRRPLPRPGRRCPRRLGMRARAGATLILAVVMYASPGPRHHGRLPPATSPTARSRRTAPLKVALAVAGSMAIQGPVVRWVADHRKHHAFSDRDGDPHSPWRYGETVPGADQGPLLRPHGLAVRRRADPAAPVRARPDEGPRHRPRISAAFPLGSRSPCCCRRCSAGC